MATSKCGMLEQVLHLLTAGACVGEHLNEPSKKPISHISTSFAEVDEEPRYIAVNSYDNSI